MKKQELIDNLEDYLLEEKEDEKSKNTIVHYRHVIELFISLLENEEVTKADMIKCKEKLIERYATPTVNNYITIINKYIKYMEIKDDDFNFMKLKKHYSKNVLKNVKVQEKASLKNVLEPKEFKRILRKAKEIKAIREYLIMKIYAYTGIRQEELKIFTVENVTNRNLKVFNKGKERNIPLRNDLRKELLEYCESEGIKAGYIFKGKKAGSMIHYTTIYKNLKKVAGQCRGINLEKIHPHSFRHLFALKCLEMGMPINEIADILGHSSIQTTSIYLRTTDKMKKEKLEKIKY